jgi:Zn-dependent peptidase ImmA (M78 family)
MEYPYLTDAAIEVAAASLLHDSFGAEVPAPVDLEAIVFDLLCEKHGLVFNDELDLRAQSADEVLGRMRPLANTIEVSAHIRESGRTGRYRFTVAHELGHWALHRPLFLGAADQGDLFSSAPTQTELVSLERNVFPSGQRGGHVPREEFQANRFAVYLLVNRDLLRSEFAVRFGTHSLVVGDVDAHESARSLARFAAATTDTGYAPLRDRFGLSTEAMAIALQARGYIVDQEPLV